MYSQKAIQKFYNYLKIYRQETYDSFLGGALLALDETKTVKYTEALKQLDKEYTIVNNFIHLMEELNQDTGKIFLDFNVLSKLLEKAKLNAKECTYIIFTMVQKNIKAHVLEEDTIFVDINDVNNYRFKTMSKKEACSLILDKEIRNLSLQAEMDPSLKEKIDEILSFSEKHAPNINHFRQNNAIIQSSYFEKINTFDEQDIKKILQSLKNMKVSENILKYVEITLKKNYQKRQEAKKEKTIILKKETPKKTLLSDKEYKTLRKKLGKYYNLYHNKLLKELTNEEMLYCLSLLYQLGVEESDIDNFLLRYRYTTPPKRSENSIIDFLSQFEKVNYYQEDEKIKEIKHNLLEYMSDIFVVDDEEYLFIKEEIEEEMNKFYYLLKGNYDYEKRIAKKLIKK